MDPSRHPWNVASRCSTDSGKILDLYQEVGLPAEERRLPSERSSQEEIGRWLEAAGHYGIEVLGPPLLDAE